MPDPILIFIHGPAAGRRVTLDAEEMTLGRSSRNDVVLNDPMVSRVHAILMKRKGVVVVEDLGSHNGTYVNDERINGLRQLHHNDRIRIGSSKMMMEDPALTQEPETQVSDGQIAVADLTFTQRQLQVLRLLARGLKNKDIGERLNVTERTVKAYLSSIFEKLEVKNRAGAVAEAMRLGLIDLPGDDTDA
ncbi:MAG TPA: FHA domain-containing protein [Actinomycetota bacterium]